MHRYYCLSCSKGGEIQCDDKIFDNFQYEVDEGDEDMLSADEIRVLCITDAEGNPGLRFEGVDGLAWSDSTGDGETQTATIMFRVTTDSQHLFIKDNHLFGDPIVTDGGGSVTVRERVRDSDGNELASKEIFYKVVLDGETEVHSAQLMDWAEFTPQHQILVQKRMRFNNQGGIPSLTFVEQTFSQVQVQVPEPGTLAWLVAGGLSTVGFACRWLLCRHPLSRKSTS